MTLVEHQMDSSSLVCFLINPIPWIPLLLLLPIFTCLSISGSWYFSFLITSLLLILSVIFHFKFIEQKQLLQEQVQPLCSEQSIECQVEDSEIFTNSRKTFQENEIDDCLGNASPDSYSESEVVDLYSSSEDSDIDWPFSGNVAGSPDFSDGSISDEESLIEIALPSGHYLGSKEEDEDDDDEGEKTQVGFAEKMSRFLSKSHFGKRSLMEVLAEINDMNEEDIFGKKL